MTSLLRDSLEDLRRRWKPLFLADLLFKLIALALLTPLLAISFRWFLSLSGQEVLADVDLLYFLLTPIGIVCLICISALWLGIVALELAALMGVLGTGPGRKSLVLNALGFASVNAWRVCRVAGHIVARCLLIAVPFLGIAGLTYWWLLREFDINYYLQQRPPAFLVALGIGGLLVVGLAGCLIYATSNWLLALPLVLFEDVRPSEALRTSRERTGGSRWRLLRAITIWAVSIVLLSSLLTSSVLMIGRAIIHRSSGSLEFLTLAIGISLLASAAVNLIVSLIGTTTFASLLFHSYREFSNPDEHRITSLWRLTSDGGSRRFRLTALRIVSAIAVGVLVAALLGLWIAKDMRLDDDVEIIAHRGASAAAPENTLAAIRQAIKEGTDWVEIDVQESVDGQVVVFHDSDFMKLAGVNRKIWEVTQEELLEIDVGSSFDPKFNSERVPTLSQVLELCKDKAGVNIELKYYGHDQQLEQRVIDLVEAQQMTEQVIYMSLEKDAVGKLKAMRPQSRSGLLLSVSVGDLSNLRADFLAINASFASRAMIRKAHELDKQVFVWTVNDPVTMAVMVGRGVDGLITDKPALAKRVLAQRSRLNVAERLMLEFADLFGITPAINQQ